jgi:HK97 family phage major capsid protein
MDPVEIKTLVEQIGTNFDEFKSHYTGRLDAIETKVNRPGFGGGGRETSAALIEGKQELSRFMRSGAIERKAMSEGSDPAGGYLVTPEVSAGVTQVIFETSPLRQAGVRVEQVGSAAWTELVDKESAEANWVDETTARADTNTPNLAKLEIVAHEMDASPKATQSLIEDSNADVAGWLIQKVGDAFSLKENTAFMVGTGVGQPRGLFNYPTAATADATRAWGTFEHVATGVSSDFAASNPGDILFDVVAAMKPSYRTGPGVCWIMSRQVATKIRKFKNATDDTYLWQPGLQLGQPDVLLGYPVCIAEDTPALGSGSLSLAFVNLRRAYIVTDRVGTQVLRDPFTARPYVKFGCRRRVGGGAANFEAAKFVRFGS